MSTGEHLLPQMGEWCRSQPSLIGAPPPLEPADLPLDPVTLFRAWIIAAAGEGVPEPLAATLATVDEDGLPDSRTLILKDVDERGWAFAGTRSSRKAAQIAFNPVGALNFWWQPLMRAVRIRGGISEATVSESAADLASRSPSARAALGDSQWVLWRIDAVRVEFWQGSPDRNHTRIVYERIESGWTHSVLAVDSPKD